MAQGTEERAEGSAHDPPVRDTAAGGSPVHSEEARMEEAPAEAPAGEAPAEPVAGEAPAEHPPVAGDAGVAAPGDASVWAREDAPGARGVSAKSPKKAKKPKSRLRRWLGRIGKGFVGLVATGLVLWGLTHAFPSFGAWMADALRSVFGARFVAWLEDVAYDVKDWYERWRHGDDAPATLWEMPTGAPVATDAPPAPAPTASAPDGGAPEPPFAPPAAELPFEKVASPGDGAWIAMPEAARPTLAPALFKTMIHPDPRRSFTVLAVVAVDLRAIELQLVAGVTEPESMSIRMADRPGKIPNDDWDALVAAFNGGFKAVHGQYGMMIDGKTFLPPQEFACTVVRYLDGSLRIGSWSDLKADRERMAYLRQAPPCLVEGGDVHKALLYNEYAKGWGATVSGDTVIRRSALGLDATGQVLFYGIGEALTAQSLAQGMRAVGSDAVAELDVNYSYPRFLTYKRPGPGEPPRVESPLIPNIDATPDQYVTRPSARDFFYLARRPERLPPPGAAPPPSAEPQTSASAAPSASGSTSASASASDPSGVPGKTPSKTDK